MSTPAVRFTTSPSGLTTSIPWNPNALFKAGLLLLLTGALLQALQAPR